VACVPAVCCVATLTLGHTGGVAAQQKAGAHVTQLS